MDSRKLIAREILTGERALFQGKHLTVRDCIFEDGESPLKESRDVMIDRTMFKWKYPLWYSRDIRVTDSTWFEMARAGVWYTNNLSVQNAVIEAPKNFRRCSRLSLDQVTFVNAAETLWNCTDVKLKDVSAKGDYFAMNCENVSADHLTLVGNYSFDGAKNVEIRDSKLISKDAFWNSENVTVYNSFISGEYLGWNAKNLTLVNCTIESLQGMCYIDNLTLRNCSLINTTLAFEYSTVDVNVIGRIDSVLNPTSGTIRADQIEELILEPDKINTDMTKIIYHGSERDQKADPSDHMEPVCPMKETIDEAV